MSPRRMSFSMTTPQFLDGSKTVTRRMGWLTLAPGDRVIAIEKGMGLKKGEKQVVLGSFDVVDVRRERLDAIEHADVIAEGFPGMDTAGFVSMYSAAHSKCDGATEVTRIEFKRVEPGRAEPDPQLTLDGVTWVEAPVPTREDVLSQLMHAVATLLDDDGQSAPTTRTLAEHLSGESSPPGSKSYDETAAMMEELALRGAVDAWPGPAGYFARDDDGPDVTRWTRTPAAIEAAR